MSAQVTAMISLETIVLLAVLLWRRRAKSLTPPTRYEELAYLRGGPRAAIAAVLAVLSVRGIVVAARHRVRRAAVGGAAEPIERAVSSALFEPLGPWNLQARPPVRRALAEASRGLAGVGLLRPWPVFVLQRSAAALALLVSILLWLGNKASGQPVGMAVVLGLAALLAVWPRRTLAGRRALSHARGAHPLPAVGSPTKPESVEVGIAVALYGRRALTSLLPGFAEGAGLLTRRSKSYMFDGSLDEMNPDARWGGLGN